MTPLVLPRHRLAFFLIAASVLASDVATKRLVTANMRLGEDLPVLGDWVRLTHIQNTGAAFGLFAGARWPLIAVSVIAVGVVLGIALTRRPRGGTTVALGLILGGALGNLIDRVRMGRVVDFINVGVGDHRWPYFNVADSAVTLGVLWLALFLGLADARRAGETRIPEAPDAGVAAPGDGE